MTSSDDELHRVWHGAHAVAREEIKSLFPEWVDQHFPEWVPLGVARAAEVMLGVLPKDQESLREIVFRLATDEQMKAVWRKLEKCLLAEASDYETALTRFFVDACRAAQVQAITDPELRALRKKYMDQAAQLRESAEWLRAQILPDLALILYGAGRRQYYKDLGAEMSAAERLQYCKDLTPFAAKVEEAADICTVVADAISDADTGDNPLIIDRSNRRNDKARDIGRQYAALFQQGASQRAGDRRKRGAGNARHNKTS